MATMKMPCAVGSGGGGIYTNVATGSVTATSGTTNTVSLAFTPKHVIIVWDHQDPSVGTIISENIDGNYYASSKNYPTVGDGDITLITNGFTYSSPNTYWSYGNAFYIARG